MKMKTMIDIKQGVNVTSMSEFQMTDNVSYQVKRRADVKALKRVLKTYLHKFGFPECLNHIKYYNNFVRINNVNYNGFNKKQITKMIEMMLTKSKIKEEENDEN